MAGAATQAIEPSPPEPPRDYRIPNELIVRLKRDSAKSIDDIAKALGAKVVGRDDRLKLYRLQFADAAATTAAATQLGGDNSVGMIDSNYVVDRPTPVQSTPLTGTANQTPVLNPKSPVNGVVIGLVDTAVQMQNGLSQYSLPALTVVGQPSDPADQITHGTAMFETLLEGMSGAPSKILPVDVYPSGESTTTYEVVEGTVAAINTGANIINLSLGGTGDSTLLHSLIDQGIQKGVLFVAASGNTPGATPTYPASYPGVLAITASDANGQLASYANDGPFVRAMEPGYSTVLSQRPGLAGGRHLHRHRLCHRRHRPNHQPAARHRQPGRHPIHPIPPPAQTIAAKRISDMRSWCVILLAGLGLAGQGRSDAVDDLMRGRHAASPHSRRGAGHYPGRPNRQEVRLRHGQSGTAYPRHPENCF